MALIFDTMNSAGKKKKNPFGNDVSLTGTNNNFSTASNFDFSSSAPQQSTFNTQSTEFDFSNTGTNNQNSLDTGSSFNATDANSGSISVPNTQVNAGTLEYGSKKLTQPGFTSTNTSNYSPTTMGLINDVSSASSTESTFDPVSSPSLSSESSFTPGITPPEPTSGGGLFDYTSRDQLRDVLQDPLEGFRESLGIFNDYNNGNAPYPFMVWVPTGPPIFKIGGLPEYQGYWAFEPGSENVENMFTIMDDRERILPPIASGDFIPAPDTNGNPGLILNPGGPDEGYLPLPPMQAPSGGGSGGDGGGGGSFPLPGEEEASFDFDGWLDDLLNDLFPPEEEIPLPPPVEFPGGPISSPTPEPEDPNFDPLPPAPTLNPEAPPEELPENDKDGDGIPDEIDPDPDTPQDRDNDGIPDNEDKFPDDPNNGGVEGPDGNYELIDDINDETGDGTGGNGDTGGTGGTGGDNGFGDDFFYQNPAAGFDGDGVFNPGDVNGGGSFGSGQNGDGKLTNTPRTGINFIDSYLAVLNQSANQFIGASSYNPFGPNEAPETEGYYNLDVDDGALVENRLQNLLQSDSPYIKAARTRANEQANSRGLINSSIAAGAGERAAIESALPIASQDAQTIFSAQQANQNAANQFALNRNQFAQSSQQNAINNIANIFAQDRNNLFQGYQNAAEIGSRFGLQENEFNFEREENALNRELTEWQTEFEQAGRLDLAKINGQISLENEKLQALMREASLINEDQRQLSLTIQAGKINALMEFQNTVAAVLTGPDIADYSKPDIIARLYDDLQGALAYFDGLNGQNVRTPVNLSDIGSQFNTDYQNFQPSTGLISSRMQ